MTARDQVATFAILLRLRRAFNPDRAALFDVAARSVYFPGWPWPRPIGGWP